MGMTAKRRDTKIDKVLRKRRDDAVRRGDTETADKHRGELVRRETARRYAELQKKTRVVEGRDQPQKIKV